MSDGGRPIRAKIVCTIGPSSSEKETLVRMALAGMDVARINCGHTELEDIPRLVATISEAGRAAGRKIGVMLDLQGPRLRVGSIRGGSVELREGQELVITTEQKRGDADRISVAYPGLPDDLQPGDRIFMDDGLIRCVAREVKGRDIRCEVTDGGTLLQGKGMNFPDTKLNLATFTERDRRYLEAGLEAGIDWVAQSFVRTQGDLEQVVDAIRATGSNVPVIAKIEKGEAVNNIDAIIDSAQGIMVARGDLGVELPIEDVPIIQKRLIEKSLKAARPVVTATQMLESMVDKPRPTRAEASDVANAILDGTDAIMLSAETSIGRHPVEAIEVMSRIAARAEHCVDCARLLDDRSHWEHQTEADAIGFAACKIASDVEARAIITITRSGYTARLVSRYRPGRPVIAVSDDEAVIDSMTLVWGVTGVMSDLPEDAAEMMARAAGISAQAGLVKPGDVVVIAGGFMEEKSSQTNMVHIHTVTAI